MLKTIKAFQGEVFLELFGIINIGVGWEDILIFPYRIICLFGRRACEDLQNPEPQAGLHGHCSSGWSLKQAPCRRDRATEALPPPVPGKGQLLSGVR